MQKLFLLLKGMVNPFSLIKSLVKKPQDGSAVLDYIKFYAFYPTLLAGVTAIVIGSLAACTSWIKPFELPDSFSGAEAVMPSGIVAVRPKKADCD